MNTEIYSVYVGLIKDYQEFMATFRKLGDRKAAMVFFRRVKQLRYKLNSLEGAM